MGYNPAPDDQWTQDDLDRATAAGDYDAVNKARRAGNLQAILNPPAAEVSDAGRLAEILETPPAGPTVPGQQPGSPGIGGNGTGALVTQEDVDRLGAAGDYAEVNRLRREGRLTHLGIAPSKQL
jgi:hypothetical protein